MGVRVVTDSASGLSDSDLQRLSIAVVPLHVIAGGRQVAHAELAQPTFYERLDSMEDVPRTSQPAPSEFAEVFRPLVEDGYDVLAVLISAGMSSTVDSAEIARKSLLEERPGAAVTVLDSRSNSMEEGFAVLAAAEAAAAGDSLEECERIAREVTRRTRFLFTPHSLEHLRRGGRISGAKALLSVMLKIAPILTAEGGATGVAGVARGSRAAREKIASLMREDIEKHGLARVVVQYVADEAEARAFAAEVVEPLADGPVPVIPIHPVIGLHVGPAVGVVYQTIDPMR